MLTGREFEEKKFIADCAAKGFVEFVSPQKKAVPKTKAPAVACPLVSSPSSKSALEQAQEALQLEQANLEVARLREEHAKVDM